MQTLGCKDQLRVALCIGLAPLALTRCLANALASAPMRQVQSFMNDSYPEHAPSSRGCAGGEAAIIYLANQRGRRQKTIEKRKTDHGSPSKSSGGGGRPQ
jgi:hypothetical protein